MAHAAVFVKEEKEWIRIPVPKASTKEAQEFVEICTTDLPPDVYAEALYIGCKTLANRKMTEIPGDKSEKNRAMAKEQAQTNVTSMMAGEVRLTGGKVKTSGAVMTEALREARQYVKDAIKRQGKVKVSLVAASTITALAKQYLATEEGAELLEKAKAIVAARNAATAEAKPAAIDLSGLKADPKLLEANERRQKERKKAQTDVDPEAVMADVKAKHRQAHA